MPLALQPLTLIKDVPLLYAITLYLIFQPIPFVNPTIDVVKNTLSVSFAGIHLSFVPLAILMNENAFSVVPVVLPFPKIDIAIVILKDAGAMLLVFFKFSLIGLSGSVLDFFDIGHELSISTVNVLLKKGLNDATLLFD